MGSDADNLSRRVVVNTSNHFRDNAFELLDAYFDGFGVPTPGRDWLRIRETLGGWIQDWLPEDFRPAYFCTSSAKPSMLLAMKKITEDIGKVKDSYPKTYFINARTPNLNCARWGMPILHCPYPDLFAHYDGSSERPIKLAYLDRQCLLHRNDGTQLHFGNIIVIGAANNGTDDQRLLNQGLVPALMGVRDPASGITKAPTLLVGFIAGPRDQSSPFSDCDDSFMFTLHVTLSPTLDRIIRAIPGVSRYFLWPPMTPHITSLLQEGGIIKQYID